METGAGGEEGAGIVGGVGGGGRECVFWMCKRRLVAEVKVLVQEGQLNGLSVVWQSSWRWQAFLEANWRGQR